jgi:hypothetical protein
MEIIRGKTSLDLDVAGLTARLANYDRVLLDLGTGDGRYARYLAERDPHCFVIGVDSCRENLREHSSVKLANSLFVIASAQDLPHELSGLVSKITINFPWGSLLESLLMGDTRLLNGLEIMSRKTASLDLRLNGGAMAESGTTLEAGVMRIRNNLSHAGWQVGAPIMLDAYGLRNVPTTWAKRLAFGRDPRAMQLSGHM